MAEFSFGFTEGSFLRLSSQKHVRSVVEDLISNKQKRTNRIYQKRRRYGHYKTHKPIFLSTRRMKVSRGEDVIRITEFVILEVLHVKHCKMLMSALLWRDKFGTKHPIDMALNAFLLIFAGTFKLCYPILKSDRI